MIELLLFAILLCLCPFLRNLAAGLFWLVVTLLWWHWPGVQPGA